MEGSGRPGREGKGGKSKNIKLSFLVLIFSGGEEMVMRGEKKSGSSGQWGSRP